MPTSDKEFEDLKKQLKEIKGELADHRASSVLADARDAGDHWASRYEPWKGTDTQVSKTVVLVIPNRARNKELVPYPLWSHWVYRSILLMEEKFRGSTVFWPAIGTYRDNERKQHLDNPLVIESSAAVRDLRETTAIEDLIRLGKKMVVSMDQDSILLIAGSMRTFIENTLDKQLADKPLNYISLGKAEGEFYVVPDGMCEKQYLVKWFTDRKSYFTPAYPTIEAWNDTRAHLHLMDDIVGSAAKDRQSFFQGEMGAYSDRNRWRDYTADEFKDFNTSAADSDYTRFMDHFRSQWYSNGAANGALIDRIRK